MLRDGYARIAYGYDRRNHPVLVRYLDADGEPVQVRDGDVLKSAGMMPLAMKIPPAMRMPKGKPY